IRPDRRQFDAVVDLLRRLLHGGEAGGTMRASVERGIENAVGVRLQRTAEPRTALALRLVAGRTVGLLALRGWQRGIVGGLRRALERRQPLLQFSDAGQRRFQPPDQGQQGAGGASACPNRPTRGRRGRMRASFSATVSLLRSISGSTRSLNRAARDRVN